MSAVADTKMFSFGYIFSLSVQDIFSTKKAEKSVHIATELAADWTAGVLQPFAAHKATTVSCLFGRSIMFSFRLL